MGLVAPRHVESSWIKDGTCVPYIGRRILNHWTTREVPSLDVKDIKHSPPRAEAPQPISLMCHFTVFTGGPVWTLCLCPVPTLEPALPCGRLD